MKKLSQLGLILFLCCTFGFAQVVISGTATLSGTLTCGPVASYLPTPPASAFTFPNLQNVSGNPGTWTLCSGTTCAGGSNTGSGSNAFGVSSPSLSGAAMSQTSNGNGYNTMYYRHLTCADLPNATCVQPHVSFIVDMYFYIPAASNHLQAIEFPSIQLFDGTNHISTTMQCTVSTGTWRFWDTANNQWVDSGYACSVMSATNTWHHLQLYVTTDGTTSPTSYAFQTLVLDNTPVFLNLNRVFQSEVLSGTATVGTQQQIDNNSSATSNILYFDNYNVTEWAMGGTATGVLVPLSAPLSTGNDANSSTSPVLAFGKQGTSTASWAIPISISNCSNAQIAACTGTGSLVVSSATITGTNASDFVLGGTSTGTIASGSDLEPTVTFTPTQSAGTAESATLTVVTDAGTLTMGLTGTSATVTTFSSSSQTFASSTNYQLTGDLTCAGTCLTVGTVSNVDINLNGHTLTYCNTSSSSHVGGILMTGAPLTSPVFHNGKIVEGAGLCTGLTAVNGYGSGAIVNSADNGSVETLGLTVFNMLIGPINDARAKAFFVEGLGTTSSLGTTLHDVSYISNDTYICSSPGCRAEGQGFPYVEDQTQNFTTGTIYNVSGSGGTQGAFSIQAPNTNISYALFNPGNATVSNSNDFGLQEFGAGITASNIVIEGSGSGGSCTSCRGGQISSASRVVTGASINNSVFLTMELKNNAEYGSPTGTPNGCEIDGSDTMQINTAGDGLDESNNTFDHDIAIATAGVCPGFGFSDSGSTATAGPNVVSNSTLGCNLTSATLGTWGFCGGVRLDAQQYSPSPDNAVNFTNDNIFGDSSAVYIYYEGTPARTFTGVTLGKGSHPWSGWTLIDYYGGFYSGGNDMGLLTFIDTTFTGGAAKGSGNLSTWAGNNTGNSASILYKWTYTITVEQSSNSGPISGATVGVVDSQSGSECSATTNGSGVATCTLKDTLYQAVTGTYSTVNYNPMAITVTKAGCTTGVYTETITSTTSETKKLSGC